jgi:hypothetical protein
MKMSDTLEKEITGQHKLVVESRVDEQDKKSVDKRTEAQKRFKPLDLIAFVPVVGPIIRDVTMVEANNNFYRPRNFYAAAAYTALTYIFSFGTFMTPFILPKYL